MNSLICGSGFGLYGYLPSIYKFSKKIPKSYNWYSLKKNKEFMELIISLAMKFWMWTILIIVVILGSLINLLDKSGKTEYNYIKGKRNGKHI